MLASLAQLILAAILTVVILGGGMLGLGALMHASAQDHAEAVEAAKAERQARAFIRLLDHCEANPGVC